MDEGKILLVNLAKGKIGEDASSLLGALLVTKIGLAGLGRADKRGGPDPCKSFGFPIQATLPEAAFALHEAFLR